MRKFVFLLLAFFAAVASETIDIDWTKVKPIADYPEFWEGKSVKPPRGYFERLQYQQIGKFVANGNVAGRHDFPFKVALIPEMTFGTGLCGGSLISRWSVLTAAHCLYGASSTIVALGASDLNNPTEAFQARFRVQSTNFIIHPLYRPAVTNSDIAIVRFHHAIHMFHQAVDIVQLPSDAMMADVFANEQSWVMGFGRYSAVSNFAFNLRFIEVATMPNGGLLGCNVRFPGLVDASHICTSGIQGRGFCSGDIGAPLVIKGVDGYIQVGIASLWQSGGCATGEPSIFTRVTSFLPWIRQNM